MALDDLYEPETVADVCERIGRHEIACHLDVGKSAVSNAEAAGLFPAAWYQIVAELCAKHHMRCPRTLFRFRQHPKVGLGQ